MRFVFRPSGPNGYAVVATRCSLVVADAVFLTPVIISEALMPALVLLLS